MIQNLDIGAAAVQEVAALAHYNLVGHREAWTENGHSTDWHTAQLIQMQEHSARTSYVARHMVRSLHSVHTVITDNPPVTGPREPWLYT